MKLTPQAASAWGRLVWPLTAICILSSLLLSSPTRAKEQHQHQQPFQARPSSLKLEIPTYDLPVSSYSDPQPNITNPLDVLTSSKDHTILVRLLQRTRLIPTLIRLIEFDDGSGITILAPTNDAFRREAKKEAEAEAESTSSTSNHSKRRGLSWRRAIAEVWDEEDHDNIQAELRQRLLHHVLNYTLSYKTVSNMSDQTEDRLSTLTTLLPHAPLPVAVPDMHTTLHFPSRKALDKPTRPGPIPQPPEGPRHPGADDNGGLLGGEGQKVRAVWRWNDNAEMARAGGDGQQDERRGSLWFDVDAKGKGGVSAVKSDRARGGVVIAIDGVINVPPSLEQVVRTHKSLSLLSSLVEDKLLHTLSITAHSTFFLPSSTSFSSLDPMQESYLTRNTSREEQKDAWSVVQWDRTKILGWHVSGRGLKDEEGEWGAVGYAARLRQAVNSEGKGQVTTILGGPVHYSIDLDAKEYAVPPLLVGNGRIIEEDILTENGVIHIVDRILTPSATALELNVEKTLLALNASRFVGMMKKVGLESYLLAGGGGEDDTDDQDGISQQKWTFVVPNDEVMETWLMENPDVGAWWRRLEHETPSQEVLYNTISQDEEDEHVKIAKLLKYHIIGGLIKSRNLTDGGLVATELRDWRLKEGQQQILIAVSSPGTGHRSSKNSRDAVFGNANVISAPVTVGGKDGKEAAMIYLVSQLLTPPDNPVQTAVTSSLTLSTFVAAVFSADLDMPIKNAPGITYLVPNNDAFAALGLVMSYLLLPSPASRKELANVVEYHAMDRIVYIKDFESGQERYPTLEGSKIWAGRDADGNIEVKRENTTDEDGYTIVGRAAKVKAKDLLTNTGVLHEIDRVELPPDLAITNGKLLKGAKCETFRDLVIKAGYGFVLNGSAPSQEELMALNGEDVEASKKSGKKRREKKHKKRHRLFEDSKQAYVLLAPTDTAFTNVNLTYYLSNLVELQKLIQLHILPSPAAQDWENLRAADEQPGGGKLQLPFGLRDEVFLSSLLDTALGGKSSYGRVAFRKLPSLARSSISSVEEAGKDNDEQEEEDHLGWMVGILGSRGSSSRVGSGRSPVTFHAARLLKFGRESLPLTPTSDEDDDGSPSPLRSTVGSSPSTRGIGGVFTIDSVLVPYEPSWFHKWGWIVLTIVFALLLAALVTWAIYRWWVVERRKGAALLGEAMEGEEE